MNLKKEEFDILVKLITNSSLTGDNKVISDLINKGYIENNSITQLGIDELEPYSVKRAIFFAAGFGERLLPITLNTPKPLIRVNGTRIIDTLIDACIKAGIEEIIVVRGYLSEVFDQLNKKYPNIKFIDNEMYNKCNNISSAYLARELMQNALIFESDLILSNPKIVKKYFYNSNVLGIKTDKTDDWCIIADEDDIVLDHKLSGENCYLQIGIYYLNEEDGVRYKKHVEEAMDTKEGRKMYWEDVMHKLHPDEYQIKVRYCKKSDILEIDTFKELQEIDASYSIS